MPKLKKQNEEVSIAELCELTGDFTPVETIDLGSTILHVGVHVHLGRLVLVSTACGRAACIHM